MIRHFVLALAIALTGCNHSEGRQSQPDSDPPQRLVARFSCAGNGSPMPVLNCFVASKNAMNGSLKVRNNGDVKLYSVPELISTMNQIDVEMPLSAPYEIEAQTSGDDAFVLRIVITDGRKTVFQDEASRFGVIDINSE